MLVLGRKKDESIVIGDNIRVLVVEISGGRVKLAIDCPKDIPVHRHEIYDRIHGIDQAKRDIEERTVA